MRVVRWIALGVAALGASGCAHSPPPALPPLSATVIAVNPRTGGAGYGYEVPDSQVIVNGREPPGGSYIPNAGILGAAIGVTLDSLRNKGLFAGHAEDFALRFDEQVAAQLEARGVKSARGALRTTDMIVTPQVNLTAWGPLLFLGCDLNVRHGRQGPRDFDFERDYALRTDASYRMADSDPSWSANRAALFRELANRCVTTLVDAFVDDWEGRFRRGAEGPRVRWKRADMSRERDGVILWEKGDILAIGTGGSRVDLVERSLVLP